MTLHPTKRDAWRTIFVLSAAVLLATAPWLAGSAVADSLASKWQLSPGRVAWLTISTQLGFIVGTLLYAISNVADRYSPRWVFVVSALGGAVFNLGFAYLSEGFVSASCFRFATGLTLAGVYPVGMKIVTSWFRSALGLGLSIMVAALTLGSSMPFLVRATGTQLPWQSTVAIASAAAVAGSLLVALGVRDGPYLAAKARFDASMIWKIFGNRSFRLSSLGYFGHMWELYAFWTLIGAYLNRAPALSGTAIELRAPLAFLTIAVGAFGCVGGGFLSRRVGPRRVALWALLLSSSCCVLSGLAFDLSLPWLAVFVLVWGVVVVADSPQFSTLAAQTCPKEYVGTALTIQNGIGFAITVASIQLLSLLAGDAGWQWAFLLLAPGPILGAVATWRLGCVSD